MSLSAAEQALVLQRGVGIVVCFCVRPLVPFSVSCCSVLLLVSMGRSGQSELLGAQIQPGVAA
eukprot:11420768-Alexandrium_andersonii.AAC.1